MRPRALAPPMAAIAWVLCVAALAAQRGPAPDPVVREGTAVRLGEHTWAIPDGNVGGVPNVGIVRDHTFDLGGVVVRMLLVGPTHTKGDTGIFVDGDNVLFAGDVVMNQSFVAANAALSSVRAWLAAFDAFEALRPEAIGPAHGPIGDASLIPTLRTVMADIQTKTRAMKAQGRSVDEIAMTLQADVQAAHPRWARLNGVGAAARAAFAEAP